MIDDDADISIIEALGDAGAIDAASDLAEIGLDELIEKLTEEEFLKDIPVFGSLVKLFRAGVGVQGYLLSRKIGRFLRNLADIPEDTRREFVGRLNADPKHKKKVVDQLLLTLERLDDLDKSVLYARAFEGYILGQVDYDEFRMLGAAIDRCLISDLSSLVSSDHVARYPADVATRLMGCGFLSVATTPTVYVSGEAESQYALTRSGKLFLAVVLKKA